MMLFTKGDVVVVDGLDCLVRNVDRSAGTAQVLTPGGDYVTVALDDVTGVYFD